MSQAPETGPALPDDLPLELVVDQMERWPRSGRAMILPYDEDAVWVFQRLTDKELEQAIAEGRFGKGFTLWRPRWIETHLLNLLEGRGWSVQMGAGRIVAVQLSREFFEWLLDQAVPSAWDGESHANQAQWHKALDEAHVAIQWRACRDPFGGPVGPRVPSLRLEGEALRRYARVEPRRVYDLTGFMSEQVEALRESGLTRLRLPDARPYELRGFESAGG